MGTECQETPSSVSRGEIAMKILEVYDCEERGGWKFAMVRVKHGFPVEREPFLNPFSWWLRPKVRRVAMRGHSVCFMDTGEELAIGSSLRIREAIEEGGGEFISEKAKRVRDAQAAYLIGVDTAKG